MSLSFIDKARNYAGQAVENLGTILNLPEGRMSERLAGNWTPLTNVTPQSQDVYGGNPQPYYNASIVSTQNNPQVLNRKSSLPTGGGTGTTPTGQVLGTNTETNTNNNNLFDPVKSAIEGGYNNYFSQLDQMYGGLDSQAQAQQGIVNNSYQQNANTLNTQKQMGLQDLNTTRQKTESAQAKTLTDLADSMRNQFMSGQVMLGSRGAGDSSAANQYSYALTKLGNKQRGDVTSQTASIQNDINDREFKLKQSIDTELNNLALERDSQIQGISQWLAEAQNQIRQMRANGELSKGQDLASLSQNALNYALQQAQKVQQDWQGRQSMLEQWAMQKSNDIGALKQNLAQVSTMNPNLPAFQGLNGTPTMAQQQGNPSLFGYGTGTEDKNLLNLRIA